jgi:hypothetical protein
MVYFTRLVNLRVICVNMGIQHRITLDWLIIFNNAFSTAKLWVKA